MLTIFGRLLMSREILVSCISIPKSADLEGQDASENFKMALILCDPRPFT